MTGPGPVPSAVKSSCKNTHICEEAEISKLLALTGAANTAEGITLTATNDSACGTAVVGSGGRAEGVTSTLSVNGEGVMALPGGPSTSLITGLNRRAGSSVTVVNAAAIGAAHVSTKKDTFVD